LGIFDDMDFDESHIRDAERAEVAAAWATWEASRAPSAVDAKSRCADVLPIAVLSYGEQTEWALPLRNVDMPNLLRMQDFAEAGDFHIQFRIDKHVPAIRADAQTDMTTPQVLAEFWAAPKVGAWFRAAIRECVEKQPHLVIIRDNGGMTRGPLAAHTLANALNALQTLNGTRAFNALVFSIFPLMSADDYNKEMKAVRESMKSPDHLAEGGHIVTRSWLGFEARRVDANAKDHFDSLLDWLGANYWVDFVPPREKAGDVPAQPAPAERLPEPKAMPRKPSVPRPPRAPPSAPAGSRKPEVVAAVRATLQRARAAEEVVDIPSEDEGGHRREVPRSNRPLLRGSAALRQVSPAPPAEPQTRTRAAPHEIVGARTAVRSRAEGYGRAPLPPYASASTAAAPYASPPRAHRGPTTRSRTPLRRRSPVIGARLSPMEQRIALVERWRDWLVYKKIDEACYSALLQLAQRSDLGWEHADHMLKRMRDHQGSIRNPSAWLVAKVREAKDLEANEQPPIAGQGP
jgi:hypothetical protein